MISLHAGYLCYTWLSTFQCIFTGAELFRLLQLPHPFTSSPFFKVIFILLLDKIHVLFILKEGDDILSCIVGWFGIFILPNKVVKQMMKKIPNSVTVLIHLTV